MYMLPGYVSNHPGYGQGLPAAFESSPDKSLLCNDGVGEAEEWGKEFMLFTSFD